MLLTIKFYGKRYPRLKWLRPIGPISACVVAIIAVVAGNLQDKGIRIVGHIPAGVARCGACAVPTTDLCAQTCTC
jgi:sulfate transporter 4